MKKGTPKGGSYRREEGTPKGGSAQINRGPASCKKRIYVLFVAGWLCLFPSSMTPQALADDMWTKFGRGATNLTLGYYEVINQTMGMGKTQRWWFAFPGGLLKGLFRGTARTLTGVFEVVTFPLPIPSGYRPMMDPEFAVAPAYPPREQQPDWGEV